MLVVKRGASVQSCREKLQKPMEARKFAWSGGHALKKMLAVEIHFHSLLSGCKSKSIQASKQSERTQLTVM